VLKALLAAGADPAARNEAGQSPADAARANGEKKAVKLLEAQAAKAAEEQGAYVGA
jgi:ankyrin repeat protein